MSQVPDYPTYQYLHWRTWRGTASHTSTVGPYDRCQYTCQKLEATLNLPLGWRAVAGNKGMGIVLPLAVLGVLRRDDHVGLAAEILDGRYGVSSTLAVAASVLVAVSHGSGSEEEGGDGSDLHVCWFYW